jgi:hypothetical protein
MSLLEHRALLLVAKNWQLKMEGQNWHLFTAIFYFYATNFIYMLTFYFIYHRRNVPEPKQPVNDM